MPQHLIVSRHAAAIEFIRREAPEFQEAPALTSASPDDVRDKVVAGNVPLQLAALAAEVVTVEFSGQPPRGQEYGPAEMAAAGARLARYRVFAQPQRLRMYVLPGGATSDPFHPGILRDDGERILEDRWERIGQPVRDTRNGYPYVRQDGEIVLVTESGREVARRLVRDAFSFYDEKAYPEGMADLCSFCGFPNLQYGESRRFGYECGFCHAV